MSDSKYEKISLRDTNSFAPAKRSIRRKNAAVVHSCTHTRKIRAREWLLLFATWQEGD